MTEYTWKSRPSDGPTAHDALMPPRPEYPGPWTGPVYRRRACAEMLHDVDLTATRPPGLADVLAEHPEGGPDPARTRDLYPRLYQPVSQRHPVPADQPRGGVSAAAVPPAGQFRVYPAGPQWPGSRLRRRRHCRAHRCNTAAPGFPPGSAYLGLPGPAVRRGSPCAIELIRPRQATRTSVNPVTHARLPTLCPRIQPSACHQPLR